MRVTTPGAVPPDAAELRPRLAETSPCLRRLDQRKWTAFRVVEAFGARVGLRSDSAALLARAVARCQAAGARVLGAAPGTTMGGGRDVLVQRLLSLSTGAADAGAGARPALALYDGASRVHLTRDRDALLDEFDAALRVALADTSPTHLFVHAGVVGFGDSAIVLPGASLAGKTTLVRALLALGATYLSDDVAVVDGEGRVHPYATPLAVRADADSPQVPHDASSLGATVGRAPLPVGLVAFTHYRAGATWGPREIGSVGAAALSLLPHTAAVRHDPKRTFTLLGRLLDGALVLSGARGEADACGRALLRALEERRRQRRAASSGARTPAFPLAVDLRLAGSVAAT
ncbi:MAG: hypothetical protein ACJ79S_09290 [Gemmatimonadaceae bacterium]